MNVQDAIRECTKITRRHYTEAEKSGQAERAMAALSIEMEILELDIQETESPTQKPDGGPAFPSDIRIGQVGMSLRDWFAGQALIGMIAGGAGLEISTQQFAAQAYVLADAMLVERSK